MFDWDEVPDNIADYVAVERPDSDAESRESHDAVLGGTHQPVERSGAWVEVGGVCLASDQKPSALVPKLPVLRSWTAGEPTPAELETIRWMMQKAAMKQDHT